MGSTAVESKWVCYHCGEECADNKITEGELHFCCKGCHMVYQLLNENGLCTYYNLNHNPGSSRRKEVRKDKFAFLDDPSISAKLIDYSDSQQTHVRFYLPQVHCSSCLYLLENLHTIEPAVIRTSLHFARKNLTVVFNSGKLSLRQVAELLTSIGYEPYISLNDLGNKKPGIPRTLLYQLGVAGFCFANIMLMSFPEYLGLADAEKNLLGVFRTLNFLLALPVFFYAALPFYQSGWSGLRQRFLNIDAPIALAIIITFARSAWEILHGTGPGYFDSMTGIVFFMLAGRVLQDKTHQQLTFDRDYTSYFPVAIPVVKDGMEIPTQLPNLKPGDTIRIRNEELVPADGILTRGKARIDYSFVTGESEPVLREMGEIIYAGGRQTGGTIELLLIREVTQSYLTSLWSRDELKNETGAKSTSFVHLLSRYFTYIVFSIAILAALFWVQHDNSRVWNVVTAVLIVACPCALLLSNSFTNGNILRILSGNRFFLRNAQTIENLASCNHIVFDKTGTLTTSEEPELSYSGNPLSAEQEAALSSLASQSGHPLSRALRSHFYQDNQQEILEFREYPGLGTEGLVNGWHVALGSSAFITGKQAAQGLESRVYVSFDGNCPGYFRIRNRYRPSVPALTRTLSIKYKLSLLSGDHDAEKQRLEQWMGPGSTLLFQQKPEDKLNYILHLQKRGEKVMMIGDGLNDAGALKQSNAGVALTDNSNQFTPASDAILEAGQLPNLGRFLLLCKANRTIVMTAFLVSVMYNIVGLFFAVRGELSPVTAAILMPASSISIVLLTYGSSSLVARWLKLQGRKDNS